MYVYYVAYVVVLVTVVIMLTGLGKCIHNVS